MKKIIILIGAPGSGKGTQAKKIADKFGYCHISTGDLLRALDNDPHADNDDKQKLADMKAGGLVSNELIFRLVRKEVEKCAAEGKGMVMDGVSRSLEQAKEYQRLFEEKGLADEVQVIEIHISDNTIMKRLQIRLKTEGRRRPDDDPEIMKKRIKEQGNRTIRPILDYYKNLGILERVDGEQSIDAVWRAIIQVLSRN